MHALPDIGLLEDYAMPNGVLPLAPSRTLFKGIGSDALAAAYELSLQYPEKRGSLSYAARKLASRSSPVTKDPRLTLEAHIDGRDFPAALYDELIALGFEPDGFVRYVPTHYNVHLTSKFTVSMREGTRRAQLRGILVSQFDRAYQQLCAHGVEAYIELETYPSSNRVSWEAGLGFRDGSLLPFDLRFDPHTAQTHKSADIHVKLANGSPGVALLPLLVERGFYWVQTWAGNFVGTAEFARPADAKHVYRLLRESLNVIGGATEITLESVVELRRTPTQSGSALAWAAIPPLVTGVGISG